MSKISDARQSLFNALSPLFDEGRFSAYVPAQVVSPCGWIERPRITTRTEGRASTVIVATFSVMIAFDGRDDVQQADADERVAQVWDAAEALSLASPTTAFATPIDIGGPNTTAMRVDIDITLTARTLCTVKTSTEEAA